MLEKIKNHWQILTVILLLWSFFDLYNYYDAFNIEIQHYVTTGEIFLLVMPTILKGIFILILLLVIFLFTYEPRDSSTEREHDKLLSFKLNIKKSIEGFRRKQFRLLIFHLINFISDLLLLSFLLSTLAFLIYCLYIKNSFSSVFINYENKWGILYIVTLFLVFPILLLIHELIEHEGKIKLKKILFNNSVLLYFLLAFIINSFISNRIDYVLTIHGMGKHNLSFRKADRSYNTDSSFVYIGSAQSYLFFHNNLDSSNVVIKRDEIDSLVIK